MCSIIAYDRGKSVKEIVTILLLSEDTIYNYLQAYHHKQKTTNSTRDVTTSLLSESSKKELKEHLDAFTYLHVKEIITYD